MYALGLILSVSVAYIFGNVVNAIISKPEPLPTRPVNIVLPSPSPSVTPAPPSVAGANTANIKQIECVGPDGVHFKTTQKECDEFNAAWRNTPKQNTSPPPSYSTEPLIPCVLSYGTFQLTQSSCASFKERDTPLPSFPTYSYPTPDPLVLCVLSYGTYQVSQSYCNSAKERDKPLPAYSPPPTSANEGSADSGGLDADAAWLYRERVRQCQARLRGIGMQDSSMVEECY